MLLYTKYIFNLVTLNSETLRIFLASEIFIRIGLKTSYSYPSTFYIQICQTQNPTLKWTKNQFQDPLFI